MEKNIAIVIAGAGDNEIKDITIKPGTTASDVLNTLGLQRYTVSNSEGRLFGPRDNLYDAVEDGDKLYASAQAEVGK